MAMSFIVNFLGLHESQCRKGFFITEAYMVRRMLEFRQFPESGTSYLTVNEVLNIIT